MNKIMPSDARLLTLKPLRIAVFFWKVAIVLGVIALVLTVVKAVAPNARPSDLWLVFFVASVGLGVVYIGIMGTMTVIFWRRYRS